MPADHRLVIVHDPDDQPSTQRLLAELHDPGRGVLVVRPAPGTTNQHPLALAILASLGKQTHPPPRGVGDLWTLARAWTFGHQPEHIVVDRAHTLPQQLRADLYQLAADAAAGTLYLVVAGSTDPSLPGPAPDLVEKPSSLDMLRLHEREPPPEPAGLRVPNLTLPVDGFLTFRAACRWVLDRDDAAIVDKVWSDTFYAVNAWMYEQNAGFGRGDQLPHKVHHFVHTLSGRLAAMLTVAVNPADALVRLRAVQAAALHHGLLLHHEPPPAQFPHGAELGCQLTPAIADAINRNVSTAAAAAATIDLIYPIEPSGVRYTGPLVAVSTIAEDGSLLRTPHGQIAVPPHGQPALRAHHHRLRATGAADPNQSFFGNADRSDLARTALQPLLPQMYQPRAQYRRSRAYLRGRATTWMLRRGLQLEALPSLASYERPYRWMVG